MACNHNTVNCGCKDTYLTTPPPCPTPIDCPDPQPCSEVFPTQCIVYTGEDILCNQDIVVAQNDSVSEALTSIVDYICNLSTVAIEAGTGITVTDATVGNVTTYTVTNSSPASSVTLTSAGGTDTLVNDGTGPALAVKGLTAGAGIALFSTSDEVQIDCTLNGLPPWQVVTASSLGTYTTTLSANTRVIYTITAPGGAVFITPATPPVGTEVEILFMGSCNVSIQPGLLAANTTVGVWQPTGYIEADGDLSEKLQWGAITANTEGLRIKLVCIGNSGAGIRWVVLDQTWNDTDPVVVV
jgi:hypothetical protein